MERRENTTAHNQTLANDLFVGFLFFFKDNKYCSTFESFLEKYLLFESNYQGQVSYLSLAKPNRHGLDSAPGGTGNKFCSPGIEVEAGYKRAKKHLSQAQ